MLLDRQQFDRCFTDYKRSAWRFETQPTYTMPREQPGLARFLAGEPKLPDHNKQWHGRVRAMVAAGKTIGRVRTVRRPLTDYQRFQLAWGIPGNIEAGEDIRILDLTDLQLDLPIQDFWLYDETTVVQLNFRPDGTLMDRQKPVDSAQYLVWRDIAVSHSVPFGEWTAEHFMRDHD
ncbi:DUF6879 family protein [Actinophytocola sp.]|jgi:hypothetical protein|uniref:DUF6879 family protein n=1 Tax=Actinophytocola sp. TaxID=1872138 RepID=UPI002ED8B4C3